MKIGLTGAHGTGKTSVAEAYSAATGTPLVTSASRVVRELGWPINQQATPESQAATSMGRLAAQLSAGDDFVSDRTLLDSMAYNRWQLKNVWGSDRQAAYWYDRMSEITKNVMGFYDIVLYFPITFSLTADGVRPMEDSYQREIDAYIVELIEEYELKVLTVPSTSVKHRVNFLRGASLVVS